MEQDFAWYLFETTGSVEAYMLYQEMARNARGAAGRGGSGRVYPLRGQVKQTDVADPHPDGRRGHPFV